MSNPVIDSVTFDKQSYAVGELITAFVQYHDPDAKSYSFSAQGTDAEGNASASIAGTFRVTDPVGVTVSDDGGRAWTKVSDDGATATFTARA